MAPRFAELGLTSTPDDTLAPRPSDPAAPFLQFLRLTFAHKRKTLANNLRSAGYAPATITAALDAAQIPPQSRTEQLSLSTLATLFHALRLKP
jgi:16S rRNA (adenine1518-N6/adenine1519-N6)-dimethyltransferase